MIDSLRFDSNDPLQFEHILEKDKYWICYVCSKKISQESILCSLCQVFRPYEMYKNLVSNPMGATDEEINAV